MKNILQSDAGWEEYYDYIFPDDQGEQPNLKLLAMAKQWKTAISDDEESGESEDEDKDGDTAAGASVAELSSQEKPGSSSQGNDTPPTTTEAIDYSELDKDDEAVNDTDSSGDDDDS